jgi:hypothetical protein
VSVIQLVRETGQALAVRIRQLAKMANDLRDTATPSAPAGGEPNSHGGQLPREVFLALLNRISFSLPVEIMKCRTCSGQLRAVPVGEIRKDYYVVCDASQNFTYAGRAHTQLIDDMIGEARAILQRN